MEEDWIKTPYRVFEAIDLIDNEESFFGDITVANQAANQGGVKVCSNEDTIPDSEEAENDLWITIDEDK